MGIEFVLWILLLSVGMVLLIKGADWFVAGASSIAKSLKITSLIIGLTLVSIGTSMPEFSVSLTSSIKGFNDISFGNIIGSNIIDLVLILPICSIVSKGKLIIERQSMYLDVPVLLIILLVAILPTMINKRFTKIQGVTLLIMYIIYLVLATTIFL